MQGYEKTPADVGIYHQQWGFERISKGPWTLIQRVSVAELRECGLRKCNDASVGLRIMEASLKLATFDMRDGRTAV